jgi:lipoprotein Spr
LNYRVSAILLGILLSSCSLLTKTTAKKHIINASAPVVANKIPPKQVVYFTTPSQEQEVLSIPEPENVITNVPVVTPEMLYDLQIKYAIMLDLPVENMLEDKFIRFMEQWYGTKYKMGGEDSAGIDCSGFARMYLEKMYRILLPRTSVEQYHQTIKIPLEEAQEGDLVFFHIQRRKPVSHVGVYLRNNKFVHASARYGVIISDLNEPFYKQHFACAGRIMN